MALQEALHSAPAIASNEIALSLVFIEREQE
jgi:hypothetical protein